MTTLYHYCSNEKFHSIVTGQEIRLSSVVQSNDSSEGTVVPSLVLHAAKLDNLEPWKIDKLRIQLKNLQNHNHGMAFCLSGNGDLLSQWRGYASNGHGVSMGFSKSALEAIIFPISDPLELVEVKYEQSEPVELATKIYNKIKTIVAGDSDSFDSEIAGVLNNSVAELTIDRQRDPNVVSDYQAIGLEFYKYKSDSFSEEKEWRLLSNYHPSVTKKAKYLARTNELVPYLPLDIDSAERKRSLVEVVLGPRNITPLAVVCDFLRNNGFQNCSVRNSKAAYK